MEIREAEELLSNEILEDKGLHSLGWYLNWNVGFDHATLDGSFSADELEAIAVYMRHYANG